MTAPKPNTTNSGITASEAVVEITMESLEASNHPEAKAILALIASKVREAQILTAQFYRGTLSDHDLRELDRQTLNTWRMYEEKLSTLQPREQDKV